MPEGTIRIPTTPLLGMLLEKIENMDFDEITLEEEKLLTKIMCTLIKKL
jgi:hypothetical protein